MRMLGDVDLVSVWRNNCVRLKWRENDAAWNKIELSNKSRRFEVVGWYYYLIGENQMGTW